MPMVNGVCVVPYLKQVEQVANSSPMVLFMRGTPSCPTSRESADAAATLDQIGASYQAIDIQSDPVIRAFLPKFSGHSGVPQLFVHGEFIGGSDVIRDLAEQGELQKIADEFGALTARAS